MLKVGYILILVAGIGLIGFFGYHAVAALIAATGIHPVIKGLILCACAGVILTLCGLVIEKRREDKHASSDDD